MKKILSKKLVPAIVISGISLQFIPFNVFAANSLSSKTAITTTTTTPISKTLSDTKICLRGDFYGSNPNKVTIGFKYDAKTNKNKIKLELDDTIVKSSCGNNTYITAQLFNESGQLIKEFDLKGNDRPKFDKDVNAFNGQEFNVGDYLRITCTQGGESVKIFSPVNVSKSNTSKSSFTKDDLVDSFFKINENGLELLENKVTTEFENAYWTNDRGFTILGIAGTNFGKSNERDNKELIIKGLNGSDKVNDIKKIKLTKYDSDSNKFNVQIPEATLEELKPGTYDLGIEFAQNGKIYEQDLKSSTIRTENVSDESYLNSSHCNHQYNKCRLGYQFIADDKGSVKLKVRLKDCYCSNNECNCLK